MQYVRIPSRGKANEQAIDKAKERLLEKLLENMPNR